MLNFVPVTGNGLLFIYCLTNQTEHKHHTINSQKRFQDILYTYTRSWARLVNQKESGMHEPCSGLDLHRHGSNALAKASRLIELKAEVLKLLLQRSRRGGRVSFTTRHRGRAESRRKRTKRFSPERKADKRR